MVKPLDAIEQLKKEIFTLKTENITFQQERIKTENHLSVTQAIMKFRKWRAYFESQNSTVTTQDIPHEYFDLIAVLAHESDESLEALATRINDILTPFEKNDKAIESFKESIKEIIKATAYQERYGLGDVVLLIEDAPPTIPERFSFYRWQAHDTTTFPFDLQQAAAKKRDSRKQVCGSINNVTKTFQSLDNQKQLELLHTNRETRLKPIHRMTSEIFVSEVPELFTPFEKTGYMTIAPIVSVKREPIATNFTTLLHSGLDDSIDLKQRFFNSLSTQFKKKRGYKLDVDIQKSLKENRPDQLDLLRMKLLAFHEDVRPAYYGTCSKTSNVVTGRRPFAKDRLLLNYEVDSEPEWDHDVDADDVYDLVSSPNDVYGLLSSDEDLSGWESGLEEQIVHMEETRGDEDTIMDRWIVPDGYITDNEGVRIETAPSKKRHVVSRPAKWPVLTNKHFPMKPIILGPSFESTNEPANHPLSDFRLHMLDGQPTQGCPIFEDHVFVETKENEDTKDMTSSLPLVAIYEADKAKPLLYEKEVDKLSNVDRSQLIQVILENKSKTLMGIMNAIRSKKILCDYTPAQLQAIVHDVAVQEVRGNSKEYVWFLREDE
ncbi:hypothetical protein G6F43_006859 [Rhizopus delemar]|nr:hypothetical protein G6F43_006859 [Rhizopus delemar]